jgi:hypothetical protein
MATSAEITEFAMTRREWLIQCAVGGPYGLAVLFLFLWLSHAVGQEMGQHPTASDPYGRARSVQGANCCHGADCKEWLGPPPSRARENGVMGWMFGRWFFRDDQEIDVSTLRQDAWGTPTLCVGPGGSKLCFWYPREG